MSDKSSDVWDTPGQGFRSGLASSGVNNSNFIRTTPYGNSSVLTTPLGRVPVAPPLPPRPLQNNYSNNIYNSSGLYNNNFGLGGYSNYMGANYGYGYRPGFNSSGYGYGYAPTDYYGRNNPESRFIQIAEESSRPAFQTIQSFLHAFSSVAMMFDSTFNALYSSYMSFIGVADNFGKLRSVFAQVFSTLAILRTLFWFFRRLLFKLGLSKFDPKIESSWVDAFNTVSGKNGDQRQGNQKPWTTVLFLSLFTAGPYLLFKLMSQICPKPNTEVWNPVQNPGSLAVGIYDFRTSNPQELSFCANQKLMIAPDHAQPVNLPGWLLACNENKKIGLVPNNYIGMIVQSDKTGQTYVNRGQIYEPFSTSEESSIKQNKNIGEGSNKISTAENGNESENKTTE